MISDRCARRLVRVVLTLLTALWLSLPGNTGYTAPIDTTDDEEAVIFGGRSPGEAGRPAGSTPPNARPAGPFLPAGAPDLLYTPDDLILGDPVVSTALTAAEARQALQRLLGKNAWLAPLLNVETKNGRELLEKVLVIESTVKGIDWKSLQGFRRRLQQQEFNQIWRLMQAFGMKQLSAHDFKNLQRIVETVEKLRQLADRTGEREQLDRLSFALAQAQELLSRYAPSPQAARQYRQQALQNYQIILKSRQKRPTDSTDHSVETSDVQTRIFSLEQDFGDIQPLVAPAGTSVVMTSDIGMRTHPKTGKRRMHRGVDYAQAGCLGWPVRAIGAGRVVKSGWENGYGNVVIILHEIDGEKWFTRYAHLMQEGRVPVGTVVPKGATLGRCNNSGLTTGSHLHFEIRSRSEFGEVIDPKPIVAKGSRTP